MFKWCLQPVWLIKFILFISGFAPLALALVSQYAFGLHPCELCLWQRMPYTLLLLLVLWAWWPGLRLGWLLRLATLLWATEAALAAYHVGVEQHWWASATGCSTAGAAQNLDALRAQIMGAPLVACDQPEFVLAGLSMAAYNLIYSVGMWAAVLCCLFANRYSPTGKNHVV